MGDLQVHSLPNDSSMKRNSEDPSMSSQNSKRPCNERQTTLESDLAEATEAKGMTPTQGRVLFPVPKELAQAFIEQTFGLCQPHGETLEFVKDFFRRY